MSFELRMGRAASAGVLLGLVALFACHKTVQGDGVAKSEPRDVGPFDSVALEGRVHLDVATGPFEAPVLSADENVLPLVTTTVAGGKLTVRVPEGVKSKRPVTLKVHAPGVTRIESSGGVVRATGLTGPSFTLASTGDGSASIAGHVDHLTVTVSGASRVMATDLVAKEVSVDASGDAHLLVNATEKLHANLSGTASVQYRGAPALDQHVSGTGAVTPMR